MIIQLHMKATEGMFIVYSNEVHVAGILSTTLHV